MKRKNEGGESFCLHEGVKEEESWYKLKLKSEDFRGGVDSNILGWEVWIEIFRGRWCLEMEWI